MAALRVDIWSDIACPWCYIGKRRFEAALAGFEGRDGVVVHWRAFELDPTAPPVKPGDQTYAERLAQKYGTSPSQARSMIARMVATAAGEGLAFDFDRIRPGNTFDAHRLVALAAESGHADALAERFMRAYLTEGEAIGDRAALARLAVEVGLDAGAVAATLGSARFADRVRADEREAAERGFQSVPTFLFGDRLVTQGAESAANLGAALRTAAGRA